MDAGLNKGAAGMQLFFFQNCFQQGIHSFNKTWFRAGNILFSVWLHFSQLCFLAYLVTTRISCYALHTKDCNFQIDKIALKDLNEKKHEQFQDEAFEAFERVIPP